MNLLNFCFHMLLLGKAQAYILKNTNLPDENGCWLWALASSDGRYGHAYFMGQQWKAHRLSFLAFGGQLRRHQIVDHEHCNVYRCCNPQHLRGCSQSENISRCFKVGRGKSPFLPPITVVSNPSNDNWIKQRFLNAQAALGFECCCINGARLGVKVCPECEWVSDAYQIDMGATQ